eukprot:scaffold8937_cov14-Prasinocladus_malaysianus.AAC.1
MRKRIIRILFRVGHRIAGHQEVVLVRVGIRVRGAAAGCLSPSQIPSSARRTRTSSRYRMYARGSAPATNYSYTY